MRTGVLDYNKLVDMDNIKNMVSSIPMINLPLIGKSLAEVSIALVEKMVDTIGIQGIMLASKSFNFARDISKPILENDKKYIIASTCIYKEQPYVYLVNINNYEDCILGTIEKDDLKIVQSEEIFIEVMPLILDNVDMRIFEDGGKNE